MKKYFLSFLLIGDAVFLAQSSGCDYVNKEYSEKLTAHFQQLQKLLKPAKEELQELYAMYPALLDPHREVMLMVDKPFYMIEDLRIQQESIRSLERELEELKQSGDANRFNVRSLELSIAQEQNSEAKILSELDHIDSLLDASRKVQRDLKALQLKVSPWNQEKFDKAVDEITSWEYEKREAARKARNSRSMEGPVWEKLTSGIDNAFLGRIDLLSSKSLDLLLQKIALEKQLINKLLIYVKKIDKDVMYDLES